MGYLGLSRAAQGRICDGVPIDLSCVRHIVKDIISQGGVIASLLLSKD
jgi:hypothetical protein